MLLRRSLHPRVASTLLDLRSAVRRWTGWITRSVRVRPPFSARIDRQHALLRRMNELDSA
jgi:hypothetical protein